MNNHSTTQREISTNGAIQTANKIISLVRDSGIDLASVLKVDHICYRCVSEDQYHSMKQKLSDQATLLDESEI